MMISTMLILSLLGGYFLIGHVIMFEHLFWSYIDMTHHMVSHFLKSVLSSLAEKIITKIIRCFVRT